MFVSFSKTVRVLIFTVLFGVSHICFAEYVELKPDFVVNLSNDDQITFVQVSTQVRVDTSKAASALKTHDPAIRHALVMLLSSKSVKEMSSRDGKQKLREDAVQAIRNVLTEQGIKFTPPEMDEEEEKDAEGNVVTTEKDTSDYTPIQDVFFTRFIIQ